MPITAAYPLDRPIEVRAWGVVTAREIAELIRSARPRIVRECPPLLVDALDVAEAPALGELRHVVREASDVPGINKCRIALVTRSDWVYGVGRAISAYADFVGMAFEVFRDDGEARRWLEPAAPVGDPPRARGGDDAQTGATG